MFQFLFSVSAQTSRRVANKMDEQSIQNNIQIISIKSAN